METLEIIILIVVLSLLLLLLGLFIFLFFVASQKRQRVHQKKIADLKEEQLRAQIEIQEITLQHISQEIHDNIGQTLSLAKLNLNLMNIRDVENAEAKMEDSKELIGKAITELRNLAKSLNKDFILGRGFLEAIKFELDHVARVGNYENEVNITGTPYQLSAEKELILFRIVQEGLNNVIKHSNATKITLDLLYEATNFQLILADDGLVTNKWENVDKERIGSGLVNMQNRSRLIGAKIEIGNNQPSGTYIKIDLPITNV